MFSSCAIYIQWRIWGGAGEDIINAPTLWESNDLHGPLIAVKCSLIYQALNLFG